MGESASKPRIVFDFGIGVVCLLCDFQSTKVQK
jgi:hypothetical protein